MPCFAKLPVLCDTGLRVCGPAVGGRPPSKNRWIEEIDPPQPASQTFGRCKMSKHLLYYCTTRTVRTLVVLLPRSVQYIANNNDCTPYGVPFAGTAEPELFGLSTFKPELDVRDPFNE